MIKTFYKPTSVEEALLLKEKHGHLAPWFAGGAYINHFDFKAHYDQVISLEGLGLHSIHSSTGRTAIGATVPFQKIVGHSTIPEALRKAAQQAAPRPVRNRATIGGDIAIGGKKTHLTPCLIALHAEILTVDEKTIPIDDYLTQESKDLILKVIIPADETACIAEQVTLKSMGPVVTNVAVSIKRAEDNSVEKAVIAVGNLEDSVRRLSDVEKGVLDQSLKEREEIEKAVQDAVNPEEDILGSVAYKKYITGITVADGILTCLGRN